MGGFRVALLERGLKQRSVDEYARAVGRAERWCEARGLRLRSITAEQLAAYVRTVPNSASTRDILRCALSVFFAHQRRRTPPLWVVTVPKRPRGRCRALSEPQALQLETWAREHRGERGGLAVLLGLYLGLRRAEMAALRWCDFGDGWVTILGKGEVTRVLPLHPVLVEALAAWPHRGAFVFGGRFAGRHAHPETVWEWVRAATAAAGLAGVTTHQLRHTCLATANDVTGDLRAVQDFAGHARPQTTAIYTRTTERRLRAVVSALDYAAVARDVA